MTSNPCTQTGVVSEQTPVSFIFNSCHPFITTLEGEIGAVGQDVFQLLLIPDGVVGITVGVSTTCTATGFSDTFPIGFGDGISIKVPPIPTSTQFTFTYLSPTTHFLSTYVVTQNGIDNIVLSVSLSITASYDAITTGSGSITPITKSLDCNTPYYSIIFGMDNYFIKDISYVGITVGDCKKHECGLGIYTGYTQDLGGGFTFILFNILKYWRCFYR